MIQTPATRLLLDRQRAAWEQGAGVPVESLLAGADVDPETLLDLIYEDYRYRCESGPAPDEQEYCRRFAKLESQIHELFEVHHGLATILPEEDTAAGESGPRFVPYEIGAVVVERFEILEHVGQGTFAHVWRARDRKLQRDVAFKVPIRRGRFWQPALLAEARAVSEIFHPHIAPVLEVGDDPESPFIATYFVDGGSLRDRCAAGPIPLADVLRICRCIALGLAFAHRKKLIHRDLKPANILLDLALTPFIADFGLARSTDSAESDHFVGTPAYMAPEQLDAAAEPIDQRADIYALGVILYELLCGERPPRGADSITNLGESLIKRGNSPDLAAVCVKALQPEPAARYETADQFAADLESVIAGETPIYARQLTPWQRMVTVSRRAAMRHGLVAVGSIAAGGGGLAAMALLLRPRNPLAPRPIEVDSNPPGAHLTIYRRSTNNGDPMQNRGAVATGTGPLRAKLAPGEYFITAELPGGLTQEVFRQVPNGDQRNDGGHRHLRWKLDDRGRVHLTTVKILTDRAAFGECVRVGRLLVQTKQVTAGEYRAHFKPQKAPAGLKIPDDEPIQLSYDVAVEYAELRGMRLPTELEWLELCRAGVVGNGHIPEWTCTFTTMPLGGTPEFDDFSRPQYYFTRTSQDQARVSSRVGSIAALRCVRTIAP